MYQITMYVVMNYLLLIHLQVSFQQEKTQLKL